ncbi:GMC family oxidoreductase N-terminal domain-containing protein [Kribbella sp. NPDC051718]|uniref:GMC family oxidoreductase N-terminal domain-containing protein n=1 Tax=Kribbella sp. NPDC051718 TaxID=3155168 RepID=UPI003428B064
MQLTDDQRLLLARLADLAIPRDGYPSAADAGAVAFIEGVLAEDRPDWRPRVDRALNAFAAAPVLGADDGLERVLAEPDVAWLVRLVAQGYYSAPASWSMVGWRSDAGGGWSATETELAATSRAAIADRYDCVVIGSGAGGGTAAQVLAESGRSVLVVEMGGYPSTAALATDHLRNPRSVAGLPAPTDPDAAGRPRVSVVDGVARVVLPPDGGWGNNAFTVGGGTRVYGAQAWRFVPLDFGMASAYGVPEGSGLADWPITYAELEPYYSLAEQRFGVSGGGVDPWHDPRSIPLPMPPLARTEPARLLAAAAERLGWGTLDVPLLINSVEYQGRAGCARCGQCVGFACPVEAKSGTHNTALPAALATGLCTLVTETTASRLVTDDRGRVVGVELVAFDNGRVWRRTIDCAEVVVAAGATETPRLLLNSGIGNEHDQVGRYLQAHVYAGAIGLYDDEVSDLIGPGVSIATCDFRHGNDGIIGGGMLANEFVPTPAATYDYLTSSGFIPRAGIESKQAMRHESRRMMRVVGPIQEVTSPDSRVQLDPSVTDRFGLPVARISGSVHPEDLRTQTFMSAKAQAWLLEAGATRTAVSSLTTLTQASVGQHQAGTCRMGTDPIHSVTDPNGRLWTHDNVYLADASLHPTNGGVNPVLTILANSLRIATHLVRG